MRIAFAGTPEFAAVALQALLAAGHDVALVLTQPDRPAGRGLKLQPSAVKALALQHGVPVIQPRSLRLDGKYPDDAAAAQAALQAAQVECMVVAAYGLILPAWTLALPPRGCLNIHGSLLPRWRGAAPIHRAIEAGDTATGITIMQMDAGLDTGDMLLVERETIRPDDTTAGLHDRLAALGGRLIVAALARPQLTRTVQPTEGITYAHKIEKAESAIDWSQPAEVIERRARAFDAFPGTTFVLGSEVIKLWRAELLPGVPGASPGQVIAAQGTQLHVACGSGALALHTLQYPGGRRMDSAAFLQARPVASGTRLG
jgi:methionyl-tRNA formyltransferase